MMSRLLAGLSLGLVLGLSPAAAQHLTESQLLGSLQQIRETAPIVDVEVLIQELNANPGRNVAELPAWKNLALFPQLTVDIEFENDSVAIVPASYRTLGAIADALHHPLLRRYKFLIIGHTNATGKAEHNLDLSLRRANAIALALTTTFSVPAGNVVAIGVGQQLPLEKTDPKAAVNRRVQLVNLGLQR